MEGAVLHTTAISVHSERGLDSQGSMYLGAKITEPNGEGGRVKESEKYLILIGAKHFWLV
jgi:hypothetical protein